MAARSAPCGGRFAARSGAFADALFSAAFCRRPFSAARPLGTVPLFCARRNSPDQLLLVSVSSPLRPLSALPRPRPVPSPFRPRSVPVPVPFQSPSLSLPRPCPVPVPVPVPVPFLSRSCPVSVPFLSRSCPLSAPSPLRSVPSPLRPVPVPFLSPSPLLAGRRFVAFFRSEG